MSVQNRRPSDKRTLLTRTAFGAVLSVGVSLGSVAHAETGMAPDDGAIVVTAQKRREDVKHVPMSITVLKGSALEQQKVVDYQDLGRIVPGLSVTNSGASSLSRLSLRGVSSNQGSSTVGIYLEDISLTIPNLYFTGATLPTLFDIDHVEVLRGPQGTLFGASSMGGAIRFIPNKPDLEKVEGEFSGDVSSTRHAGTNYRVEGVLNLPLITDKMALRIGVQRSEDTGFVKRYDAEGDAHHNVGDERNTALRATLLIQPDDTLSIEPALLWQKDNTSGTSIFEIYGLPQYRQDKETAEHVDDRLLVPSLTVRKDMGYLQFTSVSSYVRRDNDRVMDGQVYNSGYVAAALDPDYGDVYNEIAALPGPYSNKVRAQEFSQEIRLGSKSMDQTGSRFEWQVGVYYSHESVRTLDDEYVTGLGSTLTAIYDEDPSTVLGAPLVNDELGAFHYTSRTREAALFAQATYKILPRLKFTAGGRQSWAHTSYSEFQQGWLAFGLPENYREQHNERPFIPKFSLTYDASRAATLYATAAKGYRLGGENSPLPSTCAASLADYGISSGTENFKADSLWSYEGGAKLRLFHNRLNVNASGFYIDWKNIQQAMTLDSCGYVTTVNAGSARSYGGEAEIDAQITKELALSFSGALTDAKIRKAAPGTGASDGQWLLYVPSSNFTAAADYNRALSDEIALHAHIDVNRTGKSHGSYLVSDTDYVRPSYTVVNMNIGLTKGKIDMSFFARNLFDEAKVIQRPTELFIVNGLRVRPRTLGVSGTVKF